MTAKPRNKTSEKNSSATIGFEAKLWLAPKQVRPYQPSFCKSDSTTDIAVQGHVLTPGRYVNAEAVQDEGEPFEEKMPRVVAELEALLADSAALKETIKGNKQ